MTPFDDHPLNPPEQKPDAPPSDDQSAASPSPEPFASLLPGDPISYVAINPAAAHPAKSRLPEDLRISWSWPHLIIFLAFGFGSLVIVQLVGVLLLTADRHLSAKQLQQLVESKPQFLVGTNVLWYGLLFLFLYVTLAALRGLPFWRSLGWKKLNSDPAPGKGRPWMYFLSGCGLAIFVAIASSRVKGAENAPIQELFKSRTGAMLLMGMAVFVAPLVEETVFRGYLYPVLVRIISAIARYLGFEFSNATRAGVVLSIFTTGTLFGLVHAPQLGKIWGLVSLLILVGIIFTFARAWTGTVLASFLLHLGYNSMIAVTSIIATKGFTHMPPHP